MFNLAAVQSAIAEFQFDGWLLYDFRNSNVLARRVLDLDWQTAGSRRWFYMIPAEGPPRKLVHRIEPKALDHLPGEKTVYLKWQELEAGIAELLGGAKTVAMEYSPRNANPYISRVDAGTIELVKSIGVEVISSGDLIQMFEAVLDDAARQSHRDAAVHTNSAFHRAWNFIAERVQSDGGVDEGEVEAEIMSHFAENQMTTYHPPIVARGAHAGNPHYESGTGADTKIRTGDLVLIDLWAKFDKPRAIYSDLTRMAFLGESIPQQYSEAFRVVVAARDAGIDCVRSAFAENRPLQGYEVDDAVRDVIEQAGFGEFFVHRTGHSIGEEVHGNGTHLDNLETHETRRVLPGTCFTIEPGIYNDEFGVRSEVNVLIDPDGTVHVTGGELQTEIHRIL